MRLRQSPEHPPLHTVPTLLSEVREINNRVLALRRELDQYPNYFEATTSQEEIDATFHRASIHLKQINRDETRLVILKSQLRRRGYYWE